MHGDAMIRFCCSVKFVVVKRFLKVGSMFTLVEVAGTLNDTTVSHFCQSHIGIIKLLGSFGIHVVDKDTTG